MIEQYGADLLDGLYYLTVLLKRCSSGLTEVASANKFLQKIWNLNFIIHSNKEKININQEKKLNLEINNFAYKIDQAIENFKIQCCCSIIL